MKNLIFAVTVLAVSTAQGDTINVPGDQPTIQAGGLMGVAARQPAAAPAPDNAEFRWWYPVVILGAIFGGALVIDYFRKLCPKCGRSWALRKTGKTAGKTWLRWGVEQWQCKRCGHKTWKKPMERFGGAGGA